MFTRLFVGFLFIYLFVFCFNHSETPTKSSPENFVKFRHDLAEILCKVLKLDQETWAIHLQLYKRRKIYIRTQVIMKNC